MDYIKLGLLFSAFGCFFEVIFTAAYDSVEQYIKEGKKKVDVLKSASSRIVLSSLLRCSRAVKT